MWCVMVPFVFCSLLDTLGKENKIGKNIVEGRKERALTKYPSATYFDKYLHGSTYVPLESAIAMQKEIGDELLVDFKWNNGRVTRCKRNWTCHLYPCQKLDYDHYGARFVACPSFVKKCGTDTDSRLLWVLCAILTRVQGLWIATDRCTMHQSKWYGWILVSTIRLEIYEHFDSDLI